MSKKSDILKRMSEGYEKNQDIITNNLTPLKPTRAQQKIDKSPIPMGQRMHESSEKLLKERFRLTQEDIKSQKNIPTVRGRSPLPTEKTLFRINEINVEMLYEYKWRKNISLNRILRFEEVGEQGERRRFYTLYSNKNPIKFSSISIKKDYVGGKTYNKPAVLIEQLCRDSQQGREFSVFKKINQYIFFFMVLFAKSTNQTDFESYIQTYICAFKKRAWREKRPRFSHKEVSTLRICWNNFNSRHAPSVIENILKRDISDLRKLARTCKEILKNENAIVSKDTLFLLRKVEIEIGKKTFPE